MGSYYNHNWLEFSRECALKIRNFWMKQHSLNLAYNPVLRDSISFFAPLQISRVYFV